MGESYPGAVLDFCTATIRYDHINNMKILRSKLFLAVAAVVAAVLVLHFFFPAQVVAFGRAVERQAAGLEEKRLELPDLQVAYLEGGTGEPLLLIHGFGADKDNWTRVSRHLTDRFHVYAIDLPGFGDSSKPADWTYRIQDQVERVHAIAQALKLERPHLGGSSMGGMISASYAARFPGEVASLWLLAPGGVAGAEPSEMMQRIAAGEPIPLLAKSAADFEQVFQLMFVEPPFVPGPYLEWLGARAAANYDLHLKIFGEIRNESIPLENLVGGLQVPTRIVWGEQDRVLHVSGAQVLAGLMPKASVLVMPGTGHLPMIERPQAVADDYRTFRDSLK